MSLLPKTVKDFGSKSYWDGFFRKRQNAFEWYGEYSDLCGVLHKYCKPKDHVLMAGCGNSQLSQDLYDVGYRSIVNVDISDVVIKQMEARNKIKRPDMQFIKMDLMDMGFEDESFKVVIDKGTLDAIFTSEEEKIMENVNKLFAEISRVLKVAGRYICITLAQDHILQILLDYFSKLNWFIRVHKVDMSSSSNESPLPVFAFILTKIRPNPNSALTMPQIFEMAADASDKVTRLNSTLEIKKSVQSIQEFALVKQHLKILHPEEHFQLDLWCEESQKEPRYSLTIVDLVLKHSKVTCGKFAIFIVPQGREHEWMFSVKAGQERLASSAGFQRLVIVALNRSHTYANLDKIKEELSGKVLEFAQDGVSTTVQVPFLSIGDDVGNRRQVHHGNSAITGDYVIEDVEHDGHETYRHLIFLSNKSIIQSEARLCNEITKIQSKSSKKKKAAKNKAPQNVDFSYLACQHHHAIVAGFALSEKMKSNRVSLLLIGLGGGSLPMFIDSHFPQVHLTVVELDPDIVEVAKSWFNFQESEHMNLVVSDGLQFIEETSSSTSSKFDMVIFDVDSKDASKALSCPPRQFLEEKTLLEVKSILNLGGLFILNLVCHDKEVKQELVHTIQQVLPQAYNIDIEDEVNEVMICRNIGTHGDHPNFAKDGRELEEQITAISPASNVELTCFLQNLKIV